MIRYMWHRLFGSIALAMVVFTISSSCFVSGISAQSAGSNRPGSPMINTAPSNFLVAPSFPLGYAPSSVATGDLRRSGKLDLVTADYDSGNVTVFLGNGSGDFALGASYSAGPHPSSLLVADIKGDGKSDVLVANESAGTISVLLGNGDGTLQPRQSYALGFNPSFIATGSFNTTGLTDVVAAGQSGQLAILLNDGNGNLQKPIVNLMAAMPAALTVADFNKDGRSDIALANADGTVTILLGQGRGLFQVLPAISVASGPLSSIVSGIFNPTGKVDLAITEPGQKQVSILLGNGDGTFASPVSYAVGKEPVAAVVADVNGDGIADLVVINKNSNTFSILGGNGDGTFRSSVDFIAGVAPLAAVAGDFYGTGHADLAIINHTSESISVPANNGDGTFKASRSYVAGEQPVSIASGILNGGSKPGLVVANYCGADPSCASSGNLAVFLPNEDGSYKLSSTYAAGAGPVSVVLADVNGDKNLDIVAVNRLDKTATVLLGAGDGTFRQPMTFPLAGSPVAAAVGNFINGGKPALAVLEDCGSAKCAQPGSVEILAGAGDGSFQSVMSYPVGYAPSGLAVGDINGDKNLDMVVANRCGSDATCQSPGTATVLLGDGTGKFTAGTAITLGNSPFSIALGSLTGSSLDLIVARSADNTVAVLRGNGDGTFRAAVPYSVGNNPGSLVVADFNGDGKADVAVANVNDSTVSVLFGKGDGTLQAGSAFAVGTGPVSLTAVGRTNSRHASLATANGNTGSSSLGTEITVLPNLQSDPPLTTFTLTALPTPNSTVNQAVLLTATLTGSSPHPAPSGTVTFDSDPGTGSAALSDCTDVSVTQGVSPSVISTATCTTHTLTVGSPSDSLTAVYSGDTIYDPGVGETSPAVTQTVAQLSPTLAFQATTPSSSTQVNQSVTFTATLGGVAFTPITPTGTVNFTVGTAPAITITGCGAQALALTAGVWTATCTTNALALGNNQTIGAVYAGDTNFKMATAPTISQSVVPFAATINVGTTPTAVNQQVTITAQLAGTGIAFLPTAPNGTFNFMASIGGAPATTIAGCGAVTVSATGGASCPWTPPAGTVITTYPISVTYSGDTNFTTAAPGTATQTFIPFAATINVSSPGAGTVNSPVILSAQLAGTGIAFTPTPPDGKFNFGVVVGVTTTTIPTCGAVLVNATGGASCTTSTLVAPSDAISVTYSGDPNFATATAATISQSVTQATPTLALTTSSNSTQVNQSVTFTATLGGAGVSFTPTNPTGSVNFTVGTAPAITITGCGTQGLTQTAGVWTATCTTTSLALGNNQTIGAVYTGDTNFKGATAPTISQSVTPAPATLSLTSPGASNVDASVTFTATLGGATFTPILPSGKVAFTATIGTTPTTLCSSAAVALVTGNWQATCATNMLVAPSDAIKAVYSGDNNFTVATAATMTQTVNPLSTTTTVAAAPSSTVTVGTSVTFTATVGASSVSPVTPSGTVTFAINGVTNPPDCSSPVPVTLVAGNWQAACTTASLVTPSDRIDATYNANNSDLNFTTSTTVFFETVKSNSSGATVTLSSNPSSPDVNQTATLTATVTATSGTVVPTGTVTFMQGGTTLCSTVALTVNKTNATAVCSYAFSAAVTGSSLVANYSGDTNFGKTSGNLSETVSASPTTTTLTSTPSSSTVNQQVAFTAVVTPTYTGSAVPTGKVVFTNTTTSTTLCTETLSNGTVPVCNYTFATAPAGGTYNVTAAYTSGDTNFSGSSSSTYLQTVGKTATTTSVVSSAPTGSGVNQSVTFTATITPAVTGSTNPGGTVAFSYVLNGGAPVTMCASASVSTAAGMTTAACSYALPADGSYTVTATYSGDTNFTAGTPATVIQSVGLTPTTTTLTATNSGPTVNQSVTFTATVAYPSGSTSPTGTVTFSYANGTLNLCAPVTVSTMSGTTTAKCTASFPAAATDQVVATYSGDTNFASSASSATAITVGKTGTTSAVVGSPSPSTVNQSVTFTATITPGVTPFAGSTNPTGSVAFSYVLNSGTPVTMCGVANVSSTTAGVTTATCTVTLPTAGSYAVTAAYSGDTNFVASSSPKTPQTVNPTATTVSAIAPSPASPTVNQAVTFTATVSPAVALFAGSTNPSGTVTFSYVLNGAAPVTMCSGAGVNISGTITTATCQYTLSSEGSYTIQAQYNGDTNFSASPLDSTTLAVSGTQTTTSVVASPSPSSVNQPVLFTATVTPSVAGSTNPGGTVTFTYVLNGAPPVTMCGGPVAVSTNNSTKVTTATCSYPLPQTASASAPYTITAVYSGDSNFVGGTATEGSVNQVVNAASISVVVAATSCNGVSATAAQPITSCGVNQPVTFAATLAPQFGASTAPSSTVNFTDTLTTLPLCTGVSVLNTGTKASPIFTASCAPVNTASWAANTHPVTATYNSNGSDPNYPQTTSSVLPFVVTPVGSTSAVTSSLSPSVATQQVTFTATVTPSSLLPVVPSGYFTFTSSGAWTPTASCAAAYVSPIAGGTATASCVATFPATAQSQTITATYNGDANFTTSNATFAQTVQNFAVANSVTSTLNPTPTTGPVNLTQGYSTATSSAAGTDPFNPTAVQLVVTSTGGFTDTLDLQCVVTNSSNGAVVADPTCTLASTMPGATGTALTYQVAASPSAAIGAYTVTVTATDQANPSLFQVITLTVNVVGIGNTLSLAQGASGQENVSFNTASAPAGDTLVSFACDSVAVLNTATGTTTQLPPSQWGGLTCTSPKSSVPVTGNSTSAVIIVWTAGTTSAQLRQSGTMSLAAFLGLPILVLMGWVGSRKSPRRNLLRFLGLILLIVGVSYVSGCGGSFHSSVTSSSRGIPVGNYLVQVVATDNQTPANQFYAVVPLDVSGN